MTDRAWAARGEIGNTTATDVDGNRDGKKTRWVDCPVATGTAQRSGTGLEFDESLSNRVEHGLRPLVDVKFLVHVADVIAHRLLTDLQAASDLFVGLAHRHQFENLDFSQRQAVV